MKKLGLKKTTLSRLNDNALNNVKGGTELDPFHSVEGLCPPQRTIGTDCAYTGPYFCGDTNTCIAKITDECAID